MNWLIYNSLDESQKLSVGILLIIGLMLMMCVGVYLWVCDKIKKWKTEIVIGNSDYSREQMMSGKTGWGTPSSVFLKIIYQYEDAGYTVEFKTSILRKIFCLGIYKIVAAKNI